MKPIAISAIIAIAFGLGAWGGYKQGTEHPRIFLTTNGPIVTAFGWDSGNKCVAAWSQDTNGWFQWTRLSDME